MSIHFLPSVYRWIKIIRPNFRIITLFNAVIENTEIEGIVKVTGQARVCVESLDERSFPRMWIDVRLPWWDPRRLLGIKTEKVSIPNIPSDFILDIEILNENLLAGIKNILVYSKYEMQEVSYKVPISYLELSP